VVVGSLVLVGGPLVAGCWLVGRSQVRLAGTYSDRAAGSSRAGGVRALALNGHDTPGTYGVACQMLAARVSRLMHSRTTRDLGCGQVTNR
jgi:hypothetical protein